jgi:hypothetical protein
VKREVRPRDAELHLENVSVPPEVEAAIDKRSSMAAVGNLNDYVKFQMAQGIEKGGWQRTRYARRGTRRRRAGRAVDGERGRLRDAGDAARNRSGGAPGRCRN